MPSTTNYDYVFSKFQSLFLAFILGLLLCLCLGCKSYLLIALFIFLLFCIIDALFNHIRENFTDNIDYDVSRDSKVMLDSYHLAQATDTPHRDIDTLKHETGPLDGLEPDELRNRLNYLSAATSNPLKRLSYQNYLTDADKYLADKNSLGYIQNIEIDSKIQPYVVSRYPELTQLHTSTRDCMNYGGDNPLSCFQGAKLFAQAATRNKENTLLDKGLNTENSSHLITENFQNVRLQNNEILKPFMKLTQNGLPIYNPELTRSIRDFSCAHCKLTPCVGNYCPHINQNFI